MKKIVSLLLATTVMLTMVGCGSKSAPAEESKTTEVQQTTEAEKKVDFPTKPITLICPWSAGGGSDQICRAVASVADKYLGQSMVVENKDGAGGTIGITEAKQAAPDGYTIVLATTGVFLTQPLMREVSYSLDDFESVAMVSTDEICICVPASCTANNIAELADLYKSKTLNATGNSSGSLMELLSKDVYSQAGIDVNLVPYSGGSSECIAALLGGEIEAIAVHPYEVASNISAGTIKMLGVTGDTRQTIAPDTETFSEQGIDTSFNVLKGFFVPAGTDPEVINILSETFGKIFEDDEFQKFANNINLNLTPLLGDECKQAYEKQMNATMDKAKTLLGVQ